MFSGVNLYTERLIEENKHKIRTLHRALLERKALLEDSAALIAELKKAAERRKQRRRATD